MKIHSQNGSSDASPEHVPLSEQTPFVIRSGIRLLQLNVEDITKPKISIIKHLADTHDATAILQQEMHADDINHLKIAGYDLDAHTNSTTHELLLLCIVLPVGHKWIPTEKMMIQNGLP